MCLSVLHIANIQILAMLKNCTKKIFMTQIIMMITNIEPDILECEVKWALESIATNKIVEVMEYQLS